MSNSASVNFGTLIASTEEELLRDWIDRLLLVGGLRGRLKESELHAEAREFLSAFRRILERGSSGDIAAREYDELRDILDRLSRSRAVQGFSPSETAIFVLSLKEPLYERVRGSDLSDANVWAVMTLLDTLALYSTEAYQKGREEIIVRQQQEISELSTPVVELWEGILALPLIGMLDSARTQVVMENLLQRIVDTGAEIAIIDITGVPTVDTLVAQHLLKTVAAARLMGADCLISGIRPQIAQTIVHLGVELNVVSKASLASAFAVALQRTGRYVARRSAKS